MFQVNEIVGEIGQYCRINKESSDDQHRLVVWQGRVTQNAKVSGFVDKAKLQLPLQKKLWPPRGGHRVRRPNGSAI